MATAAPTRETPEGRPGQPAPNATDTVTNGQAILADDGADVAADLLAWRCRQRQCAARPAHDPMDWWPSWSPASWRCCT
jgi:hypothetical protein